MITIENHLGKINISKKYLEYLLGTTATKCFGVVGMAKRSTAQGLFNSIFRSEKINKGIRVKYIKNAFIVDLHIIASYGMNITAIVKSISHKVKYTLEEVTGLMVSRINVFVDGIKV